MVGGIERPECCGFQPMKVAREYKAALMGEVRPGSARNSETPSFGTVHRGQQADGELTASHNAAFRLPNSQVHCIPPPNSVLNVVYLANVGL